MKKQFVIGGASCVALIIGMVTCFSINEWLIVRIPHAHTADLCTNTKEIPVQLYFWHNHRWHTEAESMVWSDNVGDNVSALVARWLHITYEEQYTAHQAHLESVLVSDQHDTAYVSCSDIFFDTNKPTYEQLLYIEGLLRTIREHIKTIQNIVFLVNHQPLETRTLDFSKPWPIRGFIHN